jgi:hypothetical protein
MLDGAVYSVAGASMQRSAQHVLCVDKTWVLMELCFCQGLAASCSYAFCCLALAKLYVRMPPKHAMLMLRCLSYALITLPAAANTPQQLGYWVG